MMLCFKGITFCPFYENCAAGKACFRKLDSSTRAEAQAWWGAKGEPPIFQFTSEPECFIKITGEK